MICDGLLGQNRLQRIAELAGNCRNFAKSLRRHQFNTVSIGSFDNPTEKSLCPRIVQPTEIIVPITIGGAQCRQKSRNFAGKSEQCDQLNRLPRMAQGKLLCFLLNLCSLFLDDQILSRIHTTKKEESFLLSS